MFLELLISTLFYILYLFYLSDNSEKHVEDTLPPTALELTGLANESFDLHHRTGFMPSVPPLTRLPLRYEIWEKALDQAKAALKTQGDANPTEEEALFAERWRQGIRKMRTLPIGPLESDIPQARRAHHVLAFLAQFYIQSLPPRADPSDRSSVVIPSPIAIPLVGISRFLGIAPIVTYADTVLWNWKLDNPYLPLSPSNLRIHDLFTGSPQEEHFFLTSARIEVCGIEAMELIAQCLLDVQHPPCPVVTARLSASLSRLAEIIEEIARILLAVKDGCRPMFFYFIFRPWIRGADQGEDSPAWFYEGVDGEGITMQCSGPSAGQSALMHAFDVFLGVNHPSTFGSKPRGCAFVDAAFDPQDRGFKETSARCPAAAAALGRGFQAGPGEFPGSCPVSGKSAIMAPTKDAHFDPTSMLPTPPTTPVKVPAALPSTSTPNQTLDTTFLARMRKYMPGSHQSFLDHLATRCIRDYVISAPELRTSYDACIAALKVFREAHIRIVTLYVIVPARSVKPFREEGEESEPVRGTGGTSLVPLLKAYRNNTVRHAVVS